MYCLYDMISIGTMFYTSFHSRDFSNSIVLTFCFDVITPGALKYNSKPAVNNENAMEH